MKHNIAAGLTLALLISACSSGTSSTEVSKNLTDAQIVALPVTAKMPTSGTAAYKGKYSDSFYGDETTGDITNTADIDLSADFGTSKMTGKLSNLKSELGATNETVIYGGTLTGSGEIVGTEFNLPISGTITDPTFALSDPDHFLVLDGVLYGVFKGTNAEAIMGHAIILGGDEYAVPFTANMQ